MKLNHSIALTWKLTTSSHLVNDSRNFYLSLSSWFSTNTISKFLNRDNLNVTNLILTFRTIKLLCIATSCSCMTLFLHLLLHALAIVVTSENDLWISHKFHKPYFFHKSLTPFSLYTLTPIHLQTYTWHKKKEKRSLHKEFAWHLLCTCTRIQNKGANIFCVVKVLTQLWIWSHIMPKLGELIP